MSELILTDIDSRGVGSLILNQPQKHNALNKKMIELIIEILSEFQRDNNVKIIVIKSEGPSFSAGADLAYMKKVSTYPLQKNRKEAELLAHLMCTLYNIKKPTLALVQGPSYGGGIGLVVCCDIAIASTAAKFCFSEVKFGLVPAVISPYVIQAIGARVAKAHFISALPFDAKKAVQMGLCHEVVHPEQLTLACDKWIEAILENGPLAIKAAKKLSNAIAPLHITPEVIDLTTEILAKLRTSEEGQEGLNAFLEKRLPAWRKNDKD